LGCIGAPGGTVGGATNRVSAPWARVSPALTALVVTAVLSSEL